MTFVFVAVGEGEEQQAPIHASAMSESQEGNHSGMRIPQTGCGGVQEDEPPAEGTFLCAPQDWQGKPGLPVPHKHPSFMRI